MKDRLKEILSSYKRGRGKLIPILQQIQERFGYLPEEEMVKVAQLCGVTESKVFGAASFYAQFRFTPIGRNRVMVCRGTACHVRGAPQILNEVKRQLAVEEGETTSDLEYTLETVACIGCCALAPCIIINNKDVHGRLTPKKVTDIFASTKKEGQDAG
ncbi:NADH-quinone oxidoreductase subunit NuoE [candidate division NPL-UPA2 bacterium Unc8]|uniref:NADH-quinone oxidoreductase subunit NuoE n=1 Tax=candidate division NPL-UPA2 bacterium Unc8 TaxID=1980939 RepID=A0A399FX88_UNCN2|nr:MAG: NADH-quinone oxidoreductase subunit NuoE [candidate division NPL-UPA2 bacterium Unc8]